MSGTQLIAIAATGNVESRDGELYSVVLSAAVGAAASVVVKSGGSGGTTILTLTALIGDTVSAQFNGAGYESPLHATLTGAGAACSFEVG